MKKAADEFLSMYSVEKGLDVESHRQVQQNLIKNNYTFQFILYFVYFITFTKITPFL